MLNEFILSKVDTYIVGCSAGPDSMFLLDNLVKLNYKNIIPVHINYNKRTNSNLDEEIFIKYCKAKKLNSIVKKVKDFEYEKIATLKQNKNFQTIARIIRYDFFQEIAKKNHGKILIAHNQNDLIETYLLQKDRNNIVSYYGLQEKSKYGKNNIEVLRPMLNLKKTEIISYLEKNQIKYAIDYTNDLELYERNRIRKKIKENNFEEYLNKIKLSNFILKEEEKKVKKYYNIIVDKNNIKLEYFNKLEDIYKEKIIYTYFLENNQNYLLNRKRKTLKELIKQINSKKPNIIFKLDSIFSFVKEYDKCYFYKNKKTEKTKIIFSEPKDIIWNKYHISFYENKSQLIDFKLVNGYYCYLDSDDFPIVLTNNELDWKTSKFNLKTINKILSKEKVPLLERKNPVFFSNKNHIVLIPKYKTFFKDKTKKYILIISM